ncbi:hypothetical protein OUZ56_033639 [Daphnia magna]|uniref:Uncharacterized protein n=1 Tax=Daphnia magna TaxID=35525 RepID=A0ABR0BAY9_9CRUS|nr:hypothetical protein OUZ56_033639 [Daphnia magna]
MEIRDHVPVRDTSDSTTFKPIGNPDVAAVHKSREQFQLVDLHASMLTTSGSTRIGVVQGNAPSYKVAVRIETKIVLCHFNESANTTGNIVQSPLKI